MRMDSRKVIFIFDMDGVLIQCSGYMQAFLDTCKIISERLGVNGYLPDESTYTLFESQGVSSEWDMVAIWIAILLEGIANDANQFHYPSTLKEIWEKKLRFGINHRPNFETVIRSLRSISIPGKSIAESLFISEIISKNTEFLPQLSLQPILKDLLLTSRNLETNLASLLFENLVLGNEVFAQVLGSQPLIELPSYLEKFDKPLLSTAKTRKILALQESKSISAVVCTSRPSSAPDGMNSSNGYFLPEVEIGLTQAGMERIPFIGWGGILALAREKGDQPDNLLKPQPVQLLASIPVALGVEQSVALRWAYDVWKLFMEQNGESSRKVENSFALVSKISLHIFEDLTTGLVAGKLASKILETLPINVELHLWGITQDEMKAKAIRDVGAMVFPDVNTAVENALVLEKLNEG